MKTGISFIVGTLVVIAFASCGKKSLSGQYRSEATVSTAVMGNTHVLQVLDFRSDGTYSFNINAQDSTRNVEAADIKTGTYTIEHNKVFLTQTSDVHRSSRNGSELPSKTSTKVQQQTLTIEPNGDLVEGNARFKKQ